MPGYNYNNVSTDVDDLPYGIHRGGNLQGTPDANGMLVVLRTLPENTNVHTQIFYSIRGSIYIRSGYSGNWTGWMNITLTGQYPDLSSLASALGVELNIKTITLNNISSATQIKLGTGVFLAFQPSAMRSTLLSVDWWSTEIGTIKDIGSFANNIGTFTKETRTGYVTFTPTNTVEELRIFFVGKERV